MGDSNKEVCAACQRPPRSNSYLHHCQNCLRSFHATCSKLATVTFDDGKQGKACPGCIAMAVPSNDLTRNKVLKRTNSRRSNPSTLGLIDTANNAVDSSRTVTQQEELLSQNETVADAPVEDAQKPSLSLILEEIRGLRTTFSTALETRVEELSRNFNDRFDELKDQLGDVDLQSIATRVADTETGLQDVRNELAELKNQLSCSAMQGTGATVPDLGSKLKQLEETNASLSSQLARVTTMRVPSSPDLVIGGLVVPDGVDVKRLVAAVLQTVHPDLETRDVLATRFLIRRDAVSSAAAMAQESAANTDTTSASSSNSNLNLKSKHATAKTAPASTTASQTTSFAASRPASIVVTLTSRPLLEAIIRDKIKLGKLHTTNINLSSLPGLDRTVLTEGLLNINEFLPSKVFRLYGLVRRRAKLPDSGFVTYVRSGQIYVRRKGGTASTIITTGEDLDRFLDL